MQSKKYADKLVGWKYYNTITKKAMEKEFSWSGLIISLSIAFFIVLISAQILNGLYRATIKKPYALQSSNQQIDYNGYRTSNNPHKIQLIVPELKIALADISNNIKLINLDPRPSHLSG